jgi:hypothetical protein
MAGYLGNIPSAVPLTSADIADGIITSAKITNGTIAIADFSATGTPSASTFLRGDNAWGSAGASAGQVIQVLSATDSTSRSTSSTSFVTGSNTLSVSITPSSASNKILILTHVIGRGDPSVANIFLTIFRDATNLGNGNSGFATDYNGHLTAMSGAYLDSPATTSATTYQVYFRMSTSTGNIGQGSMNTITCLEIKG